MRSEDKPGVFTFFIICIIIIIALFRKLLIKFLENLAACRVGPITRAPTIVFPRHKSTVKENHEAVRFLCGYNMFNIKRKSNSPELTEKLETLLETVGCSFVFRDARVIMIKMNGFIYGAQCHEFEPEGGAAPGSYFTYQMYGIDRIQVTNYVRDGVSYLAGFCIYIQDHNSPPSLYRKDIVHRIMWAAKGARLQQRTKQILLDNSSDNVTTTRLENEEESEQRAQQIVTEDFPTTIWSVKYCETLQREVMTTTRDDTVFHKEWDNTLGAMTIHKCARCDESDQPPEYTTLFME
ncbi:unnamed protein product [Caenorhabditis brenneri]